jgi:diamine N-acetyltransferase
MTTTDDGAGEARLVVTGERVGLGPLRGDLVPLYQRWVNDLQVSRGLGMRQVMTEEAERSWYEEFSKQDPSRVSFTIYDLDDLAPVGTTSLFEIDPFHGTATFGIMVAERRDQGFGTEATRLMLEWGFTVLGLHNIELRVWDWNAGAIRAYTRAGFRETGRRRGGVVVMGRRYDIVYMDAIAPEFKGSALTDLIPEGGQPLA